MSLFKSNDLEDFTTPRVKEASACEDRLPVEGIIFPTNETLQDGLKFISMGKSIHYATAGLWSSHELLFHLLSFTGPADVHIATWSIKEMPVRMLVNGVESGLIRSLSCLLDVRVKVQTPAVYTMAKLHSAKIRQSVCHAKVTVIQNEQWGIAIVGSANYTNNPRIEAGVIACDHTIASFHRSWIDAELDKAYPFDNKKAPTT